MSYDTMDEILDFAIAKEEEAARLYSELAEKMKHPGMRDALLEFAKEEISHKERLLQVKAG
jgi:rubrerythrin